MDCTALARITTHAKSIAIEIRRWNEQRLEQQIIAQRQVIDIEVQQKAETKASELLSAQIQNCERLQVIQQQRAKLQHDTLDYYKQWLFWAGIHLSRTVPALIILAMCSAISWGFGVFIGLNTLPSTVGCPSTSSPCYQWRLNKDSTIAPDKAVINRQVVPLKKKPKKKG